MTQELGDEEILKATQTAVDDLLDHIYEYSTTSEGVITRLYNFARAVIAADRAKRVPMTPDAWVNPLHPEQLSDKPIPNWTPLYRLMSKISDPKNAAAFSADAAIKAFSGVKT